MIFDNADVLSPPALEAYFPPGRKGNILIISRNSAMKTLTLPGNSLEVTEMEEMDAIELLLKASCLESPTSDVEVEASKIVKKLFCFPLAIDQGGAYIASGATTIGDYLAKYSEHRKTLLSHSEFTGASKYNRTVYETWELSYKEIQQRAESDDSHKVTAANSAMLLLKLFPFIHHEGITEEIFSYAALSEDNKTPILGLPVASSLLDRRLLPLCKTGTWDNFIFREGIQILLSFSLIKRGPSDHVYAMHPLVHAWGRDRLTLNEREKCCLMAYITLSCSLQWDQSQPYGFRRVLVTHLRANMGHEGHKSSAIYLDDASAKFGGLLWEQGYFKEAETLENKVLDARNRILGVEHRHTITAMTNLAATYRNLGKYVEAMKLEIQVLDTMSRTMGVEHIYNFYHGKSSNNIWISKKIHRGREAGDPSTGCKEQNSWNGTPRHHHSYGKSSSNISKLGKNHTGREDGDPSTGCKEKNSWSGPSRYHHSYGKSSRNISRNGKIHRGREAGDSSTG